MIQVSVAQEKTITGVISSKADGLPLPGVNIIVKGTVKGVETDFDGKYKINASSKDVLMFSFVGMESSSVLVGNKSIINVQLSEGTLLKEVVVTALGIKKERKSLTFCSRS
jgi:hypothetical protein